MKLQSICNSRVCWFLLLAASFALAPTVARADRKQELADRFAKRLPAIRQFKDAGKVGENTTGLIEAVNPADLSNAEMKNLIDGENADRQELFALIAKDQGTDAATVAGRAARRNYQNARTGDYLKTATGEWKRKQ